MGNEVVIKVEHLSKSFQIPHETRNTIREKALNFRKKIAYQTFHALMDVTFDIKKGEFFGIIGKNGCGKSTLLKVLSGIYTPDDGILDVKGEISPFLELGVGFNPELSGKDNIYLNSTILGLSKAEIDKKYKNIVDFSELEPFIDLKLKNYSSGMQVRLAFSTAIHANREILLMDEVLAVGDAGFQVKCFDIFDRIIRSGRTIVFVSHDAYAIQKYCSRVLYLDSGKASFIGSPNEALSKYQYTNIINDRTATVHDPALIINDIYAKDPVNEINIQPEEIVVESSLEPQQKTVEIEEIRFFDKDDLETDILVHGHTFRVDVVYNIREPLSNLIFGIIIRNSTRQELFATNTYSENITTGMIPAGKITISFEIINYFSPGKYTVSPAVCDQTQRIFYDSRDDFAAFHVHNPKRIISFTGMDLPHTIKLSGK